MRTLLGKWLAARTQKRQLAANSVNMEKGGAGPSTQQITAEQLWICWAYEYVYCKKSREQGKRGFKKKKQEVKFPFNSLSINIHL